MGVVFRRLHAAHGPVKRLGFHRRMGGYVQLTGTVLPGPARRQGEQPSAGALAPPVPRDMQARKNEHVGPAPQRPALHRREALEHTALKRAEQHAPTFQRPPQAGDQIRIIRLAPVVDKRDVPDYPVAALLPPAFCNVLPPDKRAEQLPIDFLQSHFSVLHNGSPQAVFLFYYTS